MTNQDFPNTDPDMAFTLKTGKLQTWQSKMALLPSFLPCIKQPTVTERSIFMQKQSSEPKQLKLMRFRLSNRQSLLFAAVSQVRRAFFLKVSSCSSSEPFYSHTFINTHLFNQLQHHLTLERLTTIVPATISQTVLLCWKKRSVMKAGKKKAMEKFLFKARTVDAERETFVAGTTSTLLG